MPYRQLADAPAQSNTSGGAAITNAQTSVTLQSASGFPAIVANGQLSVVMLNGGDPAFNPAQPFATSFEYQQVNGIAGNVLTFGPGGGSAQRVAYAGTTPQAFQSGSIPLAPIVAAGLLAEDIVASAPWKFDDQLLGTTAASIRIPAVGSIPASYLGVNFRHIQVKWFCPIGTNGTTTSLNAQFNTDTTTDYGYQILDALASSVTTSFTSGATSIRFGIVVGTNSAAGAMSGGVTEIPNAFASQAHPVLSECWRGDNVGGLGYEKIAGNWFNASAITSILVFPVSGSFAAGTLMTTYLIP